MLMEFIKVLGVSGFLGFAALLLGGLIAFMFFVLALAGRPISKMWVFVLMLALVALGVIPTSISVAGIAIELTEKQNRLAELERTADMGELAIKLSQPNLSALPDEADDSSPGVERMGNFLDGTLLKDVIGHALRSPPSHPIRIMTDLAGYGLFSHPDLFTDYLSNIQKLSQDRERDVKLIFLSDAQKKEMIRLQFKPESFERWRTNNVERLRRFFRSDIGAESLQALGLERLRPSPETLTHDEWTGIIVRSDQIIMRRMITWGGKVRVCPHMLTFHLWSGFRDKLIWSLVDFESNIDEIGFKARSEVAELMKNIFDSIYESCPEPLWE